MKSYPPGSRFMVRITNPKKTTIRDGWIIPAIYTKDGALLADTSVLVHIEPGEFKILHNMPLQCVLFDYQPVIAGE